MMKEKFNQLPEKVQKEIVSMFHSWKSVHVTFENNNYRVAPGFGVLGSYPDDYQYIGEFVDVEILTEEELQALGS